MGGFDPSSSCSARPWSFLSRDDDNYQFPSGRILRFLCGSRGTLELGSEEEERLPFWEVSKTFRGSAEREWLEEEWLPFLEGS
jgi:hypothetical protein